MVSSQGRKASSAGKAFEDNLASQLTAAGCEFVQQIRIENGSVFGGTKIVDFLILNHEDYSEGLVIEAKWQDSLGSAEEKIVFSVACIKEAYLFPSMLVIEGDGFKKGVIPWARRQVGGNLIAVKNTSEFTKWLLRSTFIPLEEAFPNLIFDSEG